MEKHQYLVDISVRVNVWIRPECQRKQFEVLKKLVDVKITDTQLTQEYYETETEIASSENNELRWD
jgi:hypothetical protein